MVIAHKGVVEHGCLKCVIVFSSRPSPRAGQRVADRLSGRRFRNLNREQVPMSLWPLSRSGTRSPSSIIAP